jgi:hypothetical protein
MTEEKWKETIGKIKDQFDVISHQTMEGEIEGESIEEIIFESPMGKMRLVHRIKPRLEKEKTHYSNRIGGETTVERVYSKDEFVDFVNLFRDDGGEWVPVDNFSFT